MAMSEVVSITYVVFFLCITTFLKGMFEKILNHSVDMEERDLYRAKIINYLKEEDLIGFVSEDTLPVYCQMYFANQEINDFRHFDGNKDLRLLDKITWLPVEEVKLKK